MAKPIVSGLQLQTAPPLALPASVRTFISNQGESSQYNYSQLVNSFSDFVNAGTANQLPTAGLQGRHFFATDSNTLWLDNGNTQVPIPVGYYAPGQLQAIAQGVNTTAATINVTPALTSYEQILNTPITVQFTSANTGPVTININNLGVVNVVKNLNTPLITGDIAAGGIVSLVYDGTNFQAISGLTGFTPATAYGITTGTNAYVVTVSYSTLLAAAQGFPFIIQFANANTAACTLAINGLAATPLRKNHNQPLITGDILANNLTHVIYDGTQFQLQAPNGPSHRDLHSTTSGSGLYSATVGWNPANNAALAGIAIAVTFASSNAGASPQLSVNGMSPATIVGADGATIAAGAIQAGATTHVIFDGTNFRAQSGYTIPVASTALTAGANITITGNTIAASGSTGVANIIAGTGIATTGGTTPTLSTNLAAGAGISITGTHPQTITNTSSTLSAGTGIGISGGVISSIVAQAFGGSTGYVHLQGGFTIQFGNIAVTEGGGGVTPTTTNLPVAWPSGTNGLLGGAAGGSGGVLQAGVGGLSSTQFVLTVYNPTAGSISDTITWVLCGS